MTTETTAKPATETVVWNGQTMKAGNCPPGDNRCLSCQRLGYHLEPVEDVAVVKQEIPTLPSMSDVVAKEPEPDPLTAFPGSKLFETNGSVVMPGEQSQVYARFDVEATLHAVVVDEGGELLRLIFGQNNLVPGPDGRFKFGQNIPAGAYCTAIVKNVSKDTKTVKGAFVATPKAGPAAGSLTSPQGTAPSAQVVHTPVVYEPMPPAMPAMVAGQSATVTPGMNECAVLLSYQDAKSLLTLINTGYPISDSERTGIVRSIHHGMQRSGMKVV